MLRREVHPVSCLIVFRSVTQTQSAAAILRKNGISSVRVKPPVKLGRGSCAFGLVLPGKYLPQALSLVQKTSLRPLGIYENTVDRWREVVL